MCFAGASLKSSLHKIFLLAFADPLTAVRVCSYSISQDKLWRPIFKM